MGKTIADVLQLRWKTLFWHLLKLCLFSVSSHQKWSKVSGAVKLRCVLLNQNCWLNLPLTAVHPQGDFVLLYANEFVAFSEFFYCIYGSVNCSHQRSARRIWIIRVCCVFCLHDLIAAQFIYFSVVARLFPIIGGCFQSNSTRWIASYWWSPWIFGGGTTVPVHCLSFLIQSLTVTMLILY